MKSQNDSILYVCLPSSRYPSLRFCYSYCWYKPNIERKDVLAEVTLSAAASNKLNCIYIAADEAIRCGDCSNIRETNKFVVKTLREVLTEEQLSQIDLLLVLSTGKKLADWKLIW